MYDLIYGAKVHQSELEKLFPNAKFKDASDEIHIDRISIEVEIEKPEYWRIMTLNGFLELSLNLQLVVRDEKDGPLFKKAFAQWEKEYPEYFKNKE